MSILSTTFFLAILLYTSVLNGLNCEMTPFEKIYVTPYQVLSTPYGSYYSPCEGIYEPVRTISRDDNGTFIIMFQKQCPICGRIYRGNDLSDGYCCEE